MGWFLDFFFFLLDVLVHLKIKNSEDFMRWKVSNTRERNFARALHTEAQDFLESFNKLLEQREAVKV